MNKKIHISETPIGPGYKPYIIAEVSGNHNGSLQRAKDLIQVANDAGADAVKLQTYTPDSLTLDSHKADFTLTEGTWKERNLYELYKEAQTPYSWLPELFSYAQHLGLTIFSSPFDIDGVRVLEDLQAPAYKIASNEMTDWPLVEAVVNTQKPVIMSTGTSTKEQVKQTIDFIEHLGGRDRLVVLHCVSAYPAPPEDMHLNTMRDIEESFGVLTGLSDHSLGTATAVAAVPLGACVIEKHITLNRDDGGPDSSFSLEPEELKQLCHDVNWAWESLGSVVYGGDTNLRNKGIYTRQFWSIKDIRKGEALSYNNIKSIRAPADAQGLATQGYRTILGALAIQDIPKHSPITENCIRKQKG